MMKKKREGNEENKIGKALVAITGELMRDLISFDNFICFPF